jgi:NAD(P)-dependent dehydrogenase (short-subunit alcohol dehydrogenase family)
VACDVSRTGDVDRAIAAMDAGGFAPDLVILNAGINLPDLEPSFRLDAAEEVFRVNVFGALAFVDRLLPRARAAGRGHFVAISSMSAFRTSGRSVAYAASKAALSMAFESLRFRYAAEPVRFTTVHLGPVDTAMWPGGKFPFLLTPEDAARRILRAVERGRTVYDCPRPIVAAARLSALIPGWALTRLERRARSMAKGRAG